jgi:hypothetical protein
MISTPRVKRGWVKRVASGGPTRQFEDPGKTFSNPRHGTCYLF